MWASSPSASGSCSVTRSTRRARGGAESFLLRRRRLLLPSIGAQPMSLWRPSGTRSPLARGRSRGPVSPSRPTEARTGVNGLPPPADAGGGFSLPRGIKRNEGVRRYQERYEGRSGDYERGKRPRPPPRTLRCAGPAGRSAAARVLAARAGRRRRARALARRRPGGAPPPRPARRVAAWLDVLALGADEEEDRAEAEQGEHERRPARDPDRDEP